MATVRFPRSWVLMGLGLALALTACHSSTAWAGDTPLSVNARSVISGAPALTGNWVMHLFVDKTQFADELYLEADASGTLTGTLTVPGNFTARLEAIKLSGNSLSFEIMAPEGPKPFRVAYQARLAPKHDAMVGFATLADGRVLGGFVAQKRPR